MAELEGIDNVMAALDDIVEAAKYATATKAKEELADSAGRNLSKRSGALSSSRNYNSKIKGDTIVVESNDKIPYANIQDKGGRIRITDKMRRKMWALYIETGNETYKAISLTKKKYLRIKKTAYSKDIDIDISRDSKLRAAIVKFNR